MERNPPTQSRLPEENIRAPLVREIKQEISDGTYETPAKIDGTVERLIKEFGPETTP